MRRNLGQLIRLGSAAALLAVLSACLPTNNFTTPGMANGGTSNAGLGGAGSGLSSTSSSDGALPPCTQYDVSTPTRAICVSCYQSILSTRCPGKPAFANCIDPSVVSGYVNLVNQCISQSTQAGFVCSATCSNGQVVNPQTCTCVAPAPGPTGQGTQNIDVGQKDFGPPIVGASFPTASVTGTPFPLPTPGVTPTSCVGQIPIFLSVQNRGDTVFRLNQYGAPVPSPTPALNTLNTPYFLGATQPVQLTTSEIADHPGTNAFTELNFLTGGTSEIIGNTTLAIVPKVTGGRVGNIATVSGATSSGAVFNDGVNTATSPVGALASAVGTSWSSAGFGARDPDGNVYFSDTTANVVDVICYNPTPTSGGTANYMTGKTPGYVACGNTGGAGPSPACPFKGASPWCQDVPAGTMVRLAGQVGQAGYDGEGNAAGKSAVLLNSPHGIAVDSSYDVYFADSGNHIIRVVTGTGYHPASVVFTVAGTPKTPGGATSADPNENQNLNFPYAVDVPVSGTNPVLYISDYQNHKIRTCTIDTHVGGGPHCPLIDLVGNGSPGFMADGIADANVSTNNWMRYPEGIQINQNGNIVYADARNHLIRALCAHLATNAKDFCQNAPDPGPPVAGVPQYSVVTIAGQPPMVAGKPSPTGTPQASDAGEGAPANLASITYPKQILFGKRYSDDAAGIDDKFFNDNNIIFTESLLGGLFKGGFSTPSPIVQSSGLGSTQPVTAISAMMMGNVHTCLMDTTGKVSCLGDNSQKQLGDPAAASSAVFPDPLASLNLSISSTIGGGTYQTCVAQGGSAIMYCWGDNQAGQVGNNSVAAVNAPARVSSGLGSGLIAPSGPVNPVWADPVGGDNHTCAVDLNSSDTWGNAPGNTPNGPYGLSGESVWCWGSNGYGQLGTGAKDNGRDHGYPAVRVSLTNTTDGDAGAVTGMQLAAGQDFTCMAYYVSYVGTSPYEIACWGDNSSGQCGADPSTTQNEMDPSPVIKQTATTPGDIYAVAAGGNHACAWDTAGGPLSCWGNDGSGELGDGKINLTGTPTPAVVQGLLNVLGSTTVGSLTPPAIGTGAINPYYATVAAGNTHTCAITGQGTASTPPTVYCWGDNTFGQLGNDDVAGSSAPMAVIGLPNGTISGIFAGPGGVGDGGSNSTCAIINSTPYCWGQNAQNQLGQGPTAPNPSGNIVRIICGDNSSTKGSGFCYQQPKPTYTPLPPSTVNLQGAVYTIAGKSGTSGNGSTGDGYNARGGLFARVGGVTFDTYKNLIISDGGYTSNSGTVYNGYRLRFVYNDVVGPESGMKYGVTDSNGQSSYWCLRLKPLTYCDSEGNCLCSMVPPTDDPDPEFWEAIAAGLYCN